MLDFSYIDPTASEQILFLEMEKGDQGWTEGYRYMIETPEEEEFFFAERERAEDFIERVGLQVISIPNMMELRRKRFPEAYNGC